MLSKKHDGTVEETVGKEGLGNQYPPFSGYLILGIYLEYVRKVPHFTVNRRTI